MSDSIEELSREYMENVWENHARSVGLFPIPEYPEYEAERGMWSTALEVLLTTLRYIAPATLLTLFWGQQSFLFKLLKYIDSAVRSLIFSSEEQKQSILQWLGDAGPVRVDKLDVVWRHGWIVCGVLDAALPGACAGHPPTKLSLKHAQSIADNYLGVEPVFSRQELESNNSLSRHQEWKLINYLENIKLSISKITPATPLRSSNTPIEKTTAEVANYTLDYVARGSGLIAAQVNNKAHFKIYPTAQQSLDPGEINILIHGPKDTYGITVLPPILGKAQMIRQNLLGVQSKTTHTENILPITQGTTYLRTYGNNMNKTFYIPKTKYDLDIDIEITQDHARIGYIANLEGKYQISITTRGQDVVGSPFTVTASNNIIGHLERDSFCLEDGEEIDIVDIKTDKKVVLRIVDFVSEKMLLKENGSFEKITEEEAQHLMQTENKIKKDKDYKTKNKKSKGIKSYSFYYAARKIITINRICKIFQNVRHENSNLNPKTKTKVDKHEIYYNQKQGFPDILNSTIYNKQSSTQKLLEKRNRIIIPENLSVSLLTERPNTFPGEKQLDRISELNRNIDTGTSVNYHLLKADRFEDDTISVDTVQSSITNPFINDLYNQSYTIEKDLRPFISNEYETHNSQNEETEQITEKLFVDNTFQTCNPFVSSIELERPKTPVYKIISGQVTNRKDSVYIDSNQVNSVDENMFGRQNPFLKHETEAAALYQEKPDFIIGAPVSLPPVNLITSTTSTKTNNDKKRKTEKKNKTITDDEKAIKSTFNLSTKCTSDEKDHLFDQNFSSLDSNATQDIIIIPRRSLTPTTISQSQSSREMSPKKDTWDSAYVSIDDNNYLSENNSNELINEALHRRKSTFSEELSKMGPAEREIWQCDSDLKDGSYLDDDYRLHKCDFKRPEFTPIIEENERNLISVLKEDIYGNKGITDSVVETFAELDDIYNDFHTNSETNSMTTTSDSKLQNLSIDYTLERNDICVDSASEIVTDVKRQAKKLEGRISEVQVNATESVSVSQSLRVNNDKNYQEQNNNEEIQFGDRIFSNIVLEKKKYWDDKIRQIEAKTEEVKVLQNKRKLTSKHFQRNDSISIRKSKKIDQHQLKLGQGEDIQTKSNTQIVRTETSDSIEAIKRVKVCGNISVESNKFDLLTCNEQTPDIIEKKSVSESINEKKTTSVNFSKDDVTDNKKERSNSILQLKQELSEKVFQAFETSPKRFFGTSREQILNKIDTFLTSPENNEEIQDTTVVNRESGLVSSRISLFHNISQTEDIPYLRYRKSKSLHNISHQNSESSLSSVQTNNKSKHAEHNQNKRNESDCFSDLNTNMNNEIQSSSTSIKEKRARLTQNINNKSFDDTLSTKSSNFENDNNYVKRAINVFNKQISTHFQSSASKLKSFSKSEMDIFNKATTALNDNDLEKYKSYDELPKVSVKNFISLYEDVTKTSNTTSPVKVNYNTTKARCSFDNRSPNFIEETTTQLNTPSIETQQHQPFLLKPTPQTQSESYNSLIKSNIIAPDVEEICPSDRSASSLDIDLISNQDKETNYISLSDIEIEIIDKDLEKQEKLPDADTAHLEYKNRFTLAKKFFQSLEELRDEKTVQKFSLNEISENNKPNESLECSKRPKRSNIKKSNSMPSSEILKVWNEMHDQKEDNKKLVKISEKFNVDDLFEDVMEGRLSRQGSLRGIPHKKAVLETFRSMENITDCTLNSYEIAESQLRDFNRDSKSKCAQTYLNEYPYLPTTDPSKFYSRLDVSASGLITFKELRNIPRRNSVPDLRLNPTFTADL